MSADMNLDVPSVRSDFPILDQQIRGKPLVYFDNAATSQKPTPVVEALTHYYERDNANVHRGIHELSNRATAGFESARETTARFLNARSPNEIIFTRGATEGINLVANSWGSGQIKSGDVILLTEMEHHSNLVPWQLLAERTGATLAFLPITGDDGRLDMEQAASLLTRDVKLLAMVHISNSLGTINPVHELCARARKLGITTLVDAAQSAGHRPVDVQEMDCDFLVLSGHKMCGPTGIGVLYGREELLNAMPPWQGGGEMILNVDYQRSTWKHAPHKFEAGTPDISGAIGLATAMHYLNRVGLDRIAHHDMELGAYAFAKLSALAGIRIFGPHVGRAGIVSFCLGDVHAHDVVELANQQGVALRGGHHCTQPLMRKLGVESTSRASFYFYNTTAEVDQFVTVIGEIQKFFNG
jgi:cysteine desulfurase/selenocysteine lyase